jgi:hypothetical protein
VPLVFALGKKARNCGQGESRAHRGSVALQPLSTRRARPNGSLLTKSTKSIRDALEVLLHEIEVVRGSGFFRNLGPQERLDIVHRLYVEATQSQYFVGVSRPNLWHESLRLHVWMERPLERDARGLLDSSNVLFVDWINFFVASRSASRAISWHSGQEAR